MSSTSFPALADSPSALSEREDSAQSPSARLSRSPERSSPSTGRKSPALQMSESSQGQMFQALMSSAEDSLVRTSQVPVGRPGFPGYAADCGENLRVWFAKFDHATSSWRTAQLCLIEGWETYSETWPRSGTVASGLAFRLQHLERPTAEIGSGLLPTPTTKANQLAPSMMKHKGCRLLAEIMLPTPNAGSDHWGGSWRELGGSGNPLRGTPLGTAKIHPWEWEWMMGFPKDWTACAHSETRSFRKSRKSSGEQSYKPKGDSRDD